MKKKILFHGNEDFVYNKLDISPVSFSYYFCLNIILKHSNKENYFLGQLIKAHHRASLPLFV